MGGVGGAGRKWRWGERVGGWMGRVGGCLPSSRQLPGRQTARGPAELLVSAGRPPLHAPALQAPCPRAPHPPHACPTPAPRLPRTRPTPAPRLPHACPTPAPPAPRARRRQAADRLPGVHGGEPDRRGEPHHLHHGWVGGWAVSGWDAEWLCRQGGTASVSSRVGAGAGGLQGRVPGWLGCCQVDRAQRAAGPASVQRRPAGSRPACPWPAAHTPRTPLRSRAALAALPLTRRSRSHSYADAQPNAGDTSEGGLLARIKALAADGVYTTLIGVGLDFNRCGGRAGRGGCRGQAAGCRTPAARRQVCPQSASRWRRRWFVLNSADALFPALARPRTRLNVHPPTCTRPPAASWWRRSPGSRAPTTSRCTPRVSGALLLPGARLLAGLFEPTASRCTPRVGACALPFGHIYSLLAGLRVPTASRRTPRVRKDRECAIAGRCRAVGAVQSRR